MKLKVKLLLRLQHPSPPYATVSHTSAAKGTRPSQLWSLDIQKQECQVAKHTLHMLCRPANPC